MEDHKGIEGGLYVRAFKETSSLDTNLQHCLVRQKGRAASVRASESMLRQQ